MKRIYLLIIVIMFLLFIKGVNSQQLGCCVKTVDKFYCQVTDKDSGECNVNSEWYGGKTNGLDSCSSDVSECEVGCCVLEGSGYPNYYKAQCDDQKSAQDEFFVGNCPDGTDPNHKIGCILDTGLDTGKCEWWTSKKCSNKFGVVDETITSETLCNEKTRQNEANKRCCKADCSYKFAYECNGEVGARGVPCGDIPESCGDKCKWGNEECKNKEEKEIGAEVIKKDGCGGIKHLTYCSTEEYCFNGVCRNANCNDKKHGDKECIKSNYEPGSRDILKICEFGVVNFVKCDEFRESVCKDNENEMASGQEFDGANCYENKWGNCFDYKGNNANDCKAKGDCEIIDGQCLPKYPPGVEFWLRDKGKNFESGKMCVSSYDDNKCVRSGDCEGGSGITLGSSGEGTSGLISCGWGCCIEKTTGVPSFTTYKLSKLANCLSIIGYEYSREFKSDYICTNKGQITYLTNCPEGVELSGSGYCKCGTTICEKSGGTCVVDIALNTETNLNNEDASSVPGAIQIDCGYGCCAYGESYSVIKSNECSGSWNNIVLCKGRAGDDVVRVDDNLKDCSVEAVEFGGNSYCKKDETVCKIV